MLTKNITIPKYEALTKDIQNALEEKEREIYPSESHQTDETKIVYIRNQPDEYLLFIRLILSDV